MVSRPPPAMSVTPTLQIDRLRDLGVADSLGRRLRLGRQVGAGGMGRVFQAVDPATGQTIAVKLIEGVGDRGLGRFSAEAEILEALDHPAIVSYVGHGTTPDGAHYLAMAWLDGDHLGEHLARGPMALADVVDLGRRVAAGLAAAHDAGVVHRDLKPNNIVLVGGDVRRATLVDFGIARRAGGDAMTRTGELIGTPGYMAPEQIRGCRDLDGRADLFALGCVLHHCVAGRPPFQADEMMTVLARVLLEEPVPLSALRGDVPPRLQRLIERLLAKDEALRPANAAEVETELHVIATALATRDERALAARPKPWLFPPPQVLLRPRRRRILLGAVVVTAVIVSVLLAALTGGNVDRFERAAATTGPDAPCGPTSRLGCAARCDRGDRDACFRDGEGRSFGLGGLRRDPRAGVASLAAACDLGLGRACDAAALVHASGEGGAPDGGVLARLLTQGCDVGSASSCAALGAEYRSDEDHLRADPIAAFRVLSRACELRGADGCRMLAELYRTGTGTAIDVGAAARLLVAGCSGGDSRACAELSRLRGRVE
jgi:hypothetical protein